MHHVPSICEVTMKKYKALLRTIRSKIRRYMNTYKHTEYIQTYSIHTYVATSN